MNLEADELRDCCASSRWVDAMADAMVAVPHTDLDGLLGASDRALAALEWADVEQALAAHPRIGERATGDGREARWSRDEQAAAAADDQRRQAELIEGNRRYERRFGHVFLLCATGMPIESVLASLRERLCNDPETERAVVREELRKIVRLRLAKAVRS